MPAETPPNADDLVCPPQVVTIDPDSRGPDWEVVCSSVDGRILLLNGADGTLNDPGNPPTPVTDGSVATACPHDREIVCSSVDGRVLILDVDSGILFEDDGATPVADGSFAVSCPGGSGATSVRRCDAETGEAIDLIVSRVDDTATIIGWVDDEGVFTAGPYPAVVGNCDDN